LRNTAIIGHQLVRPHTGQVEADEQGKVQAATSHPSPQFDEVDQDDRVAHDDTGPGD
jgi:hypothetical protein